jgi:hypothetical protein
MMDELKRTRETEAKDIGKQAEARLMQQANQERINQLQNQFNKLMMELAKPVMDVVEPLLKLATIILPPFLRIIVPIAGIFGGISRIFVKMTPYVQSLVAGIEAMALTGSKFYRGLSSTINYFLTVGEKIGFVFGKISSFFSKLPMIGSYFSKIGGFLGTFGRFLGPIGLVINAFMFINNLVKRFNEFVGTDGLVLAGIKAVGYAIYDTLIQPFVDAFKWIKEKSGFMANSPSKIGLGIYDGIVSIGPSLSDAITKPFENGYDNISKMSSNATLPTFNGVINNAVGTNIPTVTTNAVASNESVINQASIIGAIKQGIKEGIGSISVNVDLDGQKMITGISKNVGFRLDSGGVAMQTSLT